MGENEDNNMLDNQEAAATQEDSDLSKAVPLSGDTKDDILSSFFNSTTIRIVFIACLVLLFFGGMVIFYTSNKSREQKAILLSEEQLFGRSLADASGSGSAVIAKKKSIEVVGFLPSWTVAKNAPVHYKQLSQLIYFGLGVNDAGDLMEYDQNGNPTLEWQYFTGDYFTTLQQDAQKINTKVLVAIKNFDNKSIDGLISNQSATARFAKNITRLIRQYHLDGVNLDFEYITDSDFPTAHYLNTFLENVSYSLKQENQSLLLSFDVNATAVEKDKAYDMVKIGEIVDQVIVMAYDYRTASSSIAGPVAPLRANSNEMSIEKTFASLVGRVPSEKIVMGIPFYGYEWQTYSDASGSGVVSGSGALATYKRVKELLDSKSNLTLHFDELSMSPWLSYRQSGAIKQIYYEDQSSILAKIKFTKEKKIRGVAVWAIGYEGESSDLWDVFSQ